MTALVREALASVDVGAPLVHRNLAAFPLFGPALDDPGYLTLDEALRRRVVEITEVSKAGSVPDLRVVNAGSSAVLLLDGEELVGAKQNRVLNLTVLVPAGATTVIPVSCVEAGRWAWRSGTFAASPRALYARGRGRKVEQVSASLRFTGEARSDQGAVWDDIAAKAAEMRTASPTRAMADIFEHHGAGVEEYVRVLGAPAPNQVGVVFAVDGRAAGFDLFDASRTCAALLPKLVRSYALDALETSRGNGDVPGTPLLPSVVRELLDRFASAGKEAFRAAGEGESVRVSGPGVAGAALVARGRVVHVEGFATVEGAPAPGTGRIRRDLMNE